MNKKERHKNITLILGSADTGSQAELHSKLLKIGISVTQATLSRDLDELGVIKEKGVYKIPRVSDYNIQFGALHSVAPAEGPLIIVKTSPGLASAMAEAMDSSGLKSIFATIAGDDTILIVLTKGSKESTVIKEITKLLNSNSRRRLRSR
jgi:transcriptional regulator of arginine metabolism